VSREDDAQHAVQGNKDQEANVEISRQRGKLTTVTLHAYVPCAARADPCGSLVLNKKEKDPLEPARGTRAEASPAPPPAHAA